MRVFDGKTLARRSWDYGREGRVVAKKPKGFVTPKSITVTVSPEAFDMAEDMKPDFRNNRSYVVETAIRQLYAARAAAAEDPDV